MQSKEGIPLHQVGVNKRNLVNCQQGKSDFLVYQAFYPLILLNQALLSLASKTSIQYFGMPTVFVLDNSFLLQVKNNEL